MRITSWNEFMNCTAKVGHHLNNLIRRRRVDIFTKLMNSKYRVLILLLCILLILSLFFVNSYQESNKEALIHEGHAKIVQFIQLAESKVDIFDCCDFELDLTATIQYLDDLPEIYAAAYRYEDGELILLTDRNVEEVYPYPFDPTEDDEVDIAIHSAPDGEIVITHKFSESVIRNLHLQWQWIYKDNVTWLVFGGVTEHSVTASPTSINMIIVVMVSFIVNLFLVYLIIRLLTTLIFMNSLLGEELDKTTE